MSLFRWLLGMPAAALVTAALFFMMAEMIKNKHVDYPDPQPSVKLKITADPPPEGPVRPRPPSETLPKEIPPTEIDFPKRATAPTGPNVPVGPHKVEPTPPGNGNQFVGPVIRTTPPYPEGCRSKGAEGVVIVEFDVTPEGNVTNLRVTHSPDRCFDRPIRNAVSKWKYPPASTNGRAAMRYGVVETFKFQLVE